VPYFFNVEGRKREKKSLSFIFFSFCSVFPHPHKLATHSEGTNKNNEIRCKKSEKQKIEIEKR
jgi:hypothetical protein